jgi:superkiller protein 3
MKKITIIFLTFLIVFLSSISTGFSQEQPDYTYYFNLGYSKLVDGQFNQAIDIFNQTIELQPDCSEAYLGLGIAYRQLHELEKALKATQKALDYNPRYYKAYYNLGLIYEEKGKKKEALEAFKRFFKKVPEARNIPDLREKIKQLEKEA